MDEEIHFLVHWLGTHRECANQWPFNVLINRLTTAFEDDVIDEDERRDLKRIMHQIIGSENPAEWSTASSKLPLTLPEPEVIFDSNSFVLTGIFAYGNRKACESEIRIRGGDCCERVTLETTYLVIGSMSSRDWFAGNYGRKIELAVKYSQRNRPPYIISEQRFVEYLQSAL